MPAYDSTQHKQSRRAPRRKGVDVFIPAEELRKAGVDPEGPAPAYRVWGSRNGSILVRLYGRGEQ